MCIPWQFKPRQNGGRYVIITSPAGLPNFRVCVKSMGRPSTRLLRSILSILSCALQEISVLSMCRTGELSQKLSLFITTHLLPNACDIGGTLYCQPPACIVQALKYQPETWQLYQQIQSNVSMYFQSDVLVRIYPVSFYLCFLAPECRCSKLKRYLAAAKSMLILLHVFGLIIVVRVLILGSWISELKLSSQ